MILLDTHAWVWWVHGDSSLLDKHREMLDASVAEGIAVSIISCWEVAKLVEYERLELPEAVDLWIETALAYPGVELLHLSPRIVVEATKLPGKFHRDPADQLLVATARVLGLALATADRRIVRYDAVETLNLKS